MQINNTHDSGLLYQADPISKKPSSFRAKGWTSTVAGYIEEAKQLTTCILRNKKLARTSYTYHVTINFESVLTPARVVSHWTKICRALRSKGISAIWIREPNETNKVHHHLIVRNQISEFALKQIVNNTMPSRADFPWHMKVQAINDIWQLAYYVTKAKVAGYVNRRRIVDYYRDKRLLFLPNLGLKKYGTIGAFWVKPKKAIWEDIRRVEKRIADGLETPGIRDLVKHIHQLFGETVPQRKIERAIGYWSDNAAVKKLG